MATNISTIKLNASLEKVWDTLTNPEKVKLWQYGSDLITTWEVGSTIEFVTEWEGQIFKQWGKILEIKKNAETSTIVTNKGNFEAKHLVFCAGLQADRLAKKDGVDLKEKVVGFRGDYYELTEQGHHKIKHLIYPVPNPDFPFLGTSFFHYHFLGLFRRNFKYLAPKDLETLCLVLKTDL